MAKRDIDKTPQDLRDEFTSGLRRRLENLAEASEGTGARLSEMAGGLVKEEVFGIPGLVGDLTPMIAQLGGGPMSVQYANDPTFRQAVDDFQKEFGAVGLAAKAGVELSDDFLDEEGELRPEMAGRLLAPGVLYAKGATLLPELRAGIASYVRRLNNDGFFPPQLQPAGGPSIMRSEMPTDGPRTTVVESRAAGEGSGTGGPRKVQSQKEDLFVSSDNEAVVPTVRDSDNYPGPYSDTGIYSPLAAAIDNIEIPKGGITAAKLLERLRGQPRAGSELKSLGLADFLSGMGSKTLSREEALKLFEAVRPSYKVKMSFNNSTASTPPTLRGESFTYNGQDIDADPTSFGTMQRIKNARDSEMNYGVMLFGDDKGKIADRYMEPVDHDYFSSNMPGFFGHVRFSIQDIVDPEDANKTIRVAMIEEIQTDPIKAMQAYNVRLKSGGPNAAAPVLGGKQPYGAQQKLASVMMDGNADVTDLMDMLEKTRLAQYGTAALSNPTMDSIDVFFDGINSFGGFSNYAYDQGRQSQAMLDLGLHKARSADEVKAILDAQEANLPEPLLDSSDRSLLNASERRQLSKDQLLEKWTRFSDLTKSKFNTAVSQAAAQDRGFRGPTIGPALKKFFGGKSLEEKVAEDLELRIAEDAVKAAEMFQIMGAVHRLNKDYATPLLDARKFEPNDVLDPDLPDYYLDRMLLSDHAQPGTAGLGARPDLPPGDSRSSAEYGMTLPTYRKYLSEEEVQSALEAAGAGERLANSAVDVTENLQMAYRMLEQTGRDNAIRRVVAQRRKEFSSPDGVREKILGLLGGSEKSTVFYGNPNTAIDELQQYHFRNQQVKRVDEAQANAPSEATLERQFSKILADPTMGPLLRMRMSNMYNSNPLAEPTSTARDMVDNVLNPNEGTDLNMRGASASEAGQYVNVPPFLTQNDFMNFAMRVFPTEIKKLDGVDGVIVPPVEEFMAARSDEVGSLTDIESMKRITKNEKSLRRVVSKLRKMGKKKVGDVEFKQLLLDEGFDADADSFLTKVSDDAFYEDVPADKLIGEIGDVMNTDYLKNEFTRSSSTLRESSMRKARGHLQNYGDNLTGAINKLKAAGLNVKDLPVVQSFAVPGSTTNPQFGSYPPGSHAARDSFKFIDFRDPGTAEVAKKVPSAYKDGGPVDLRPKKLVHSGIGAMARQVM